MLAQDRVTFDSVCVLTHSLQKELYKLLTISRSKENLLSLKYFPLVSVTRTTAYLFPLFETKFWWTPARVLYPEKRSLLSSYVPTESVKTQAYLSKLLLLLIHLNVRQLEVESQQLLE